MTVSQNEKPRPPGQTGTRQAGQISALVRTLTRSAISGPAPDGQPGLFYYGTGSLMIPFGDGYQCVGGSLYRLPIAVAAGGVHSHELDITSPPVPSGQITAGSTWNFPAWHRDSGPGGATSNFTNGLEIGFNCRDGRPGA